MSPLKSAALNIRIDPNLKEALRVAARRDHRSIANMVEKLIIKHCESAGITIPEQQSFFGSDSSE
jgi:predicted HicB family RNase H-like nuclease